MEPFFVATALFLVFFTIPTIARHYIAGFPSYVSYGTFAWYGIGLVGAIWLLFPTLVTFFTSGDVPRETFFIGILFGIALLLSFGLARGKELLSQDMFGDVRVMSPGYVMVRALDILLQHILFLVMAECLLIFVTPAWAAGCVFVVFTVLLQAGNAFHMKRKRGFAYTTLLFGTAAVYFYTYTTLDLLWPATYVHVVVQLGVWMVASQSKNTA